jgi:hypothetical protein
MAIVIATGAEYNTLLELDAYAGTWIGSSNPAPRSGSYYFAQQAWSYYGHYWLKNFPAALSEYFMQFAFYCTYGGNAGPIIRLRNGGATLATVQFPGDNTFKLYVGDSATLVGSTGALFSGGIWYTLEIHHKVASSGGVIELRVNGITLISFTGNTNPGGLNTVNNICSSNLSGGNSQSLIYDDIIVNDTTGPVNNSWVNGARIILLRPNGAGTYSQLAPSSGANYACVNEMPPSMTSYVLGNVNGLKDTYAFPDVAADGRIIQAIKVDNFALKTGAPATNNLKGVIRTNGGDYVGSNLAVPTAMAMLPTYWELNPATGQPFTVAEINALEAGAQLAT